MNRLKEIGINREIAKTLNVLEHGQYRETKDYYKEIRNSVTNSVTIGNFEYMEETWCWVIWKTTDIDTDPQYKGEPLCKVVPKGIDKNKVGMVLNAQAWAYI